MKNILIKVDTNDADYVEILSEVDEYTLLDFLPLIEKIKNFKPYEGVSKNGLVWKHDSNFPVGCVLQPDLGEKHPTELYNITKDEYEKFMCTFNLYATDYGFHKIVSIREIEIVETLL